MLYQIITIILFYQSLIVLAQNSGRYDCKTSATNAKLDAIFAKLYTYGYSGRKFPINLAEASIYCKDTLDLIRTAESYVKSCLNEYPKRLLLIMIKTVRTQSKSLCANKLSRRMQDLFSAADCSNGAQSQYQKCINEAVDILMGTKSVNDKRKLPILCCGIHRMEKCFHDEAIKVDNVCNEAKVETSLRFLDSVQGNMISVLCLQFDESSDTCDQIVYPRRNKNQKRYKSVVLPMIQILDSVKD